MNPFLIHSLAQAELEGDAYWWCLVSWRWQNTMIIWAGLTNHTVGPRMTQNSGFQFTSPLLKACSLEWVSSTQLGNTEHGCTFQSGSPFSFMEKNSQGCRLNRRGQRGKDYGEYMITLSTILILSLNIIWLEVWQTSPKVTPLNIQKSWPYILFSSLCMV